MRSTRMSNASLCSSLGGLSTPICEKSVVPVRAFHPDFLFRISSACYVGRIVFATLAPLQSGMPRIYIHCKSSKVLTYSADMHLLGTRRAELPRLTGIVEHEPEESQKPGISLLTLSKGAHGQAKSKTILGRGLDQFITVSGWGTHDGSISPLRVAPGNPARGVNPILDLGKLVFFSPIETGRLPSPGTRGCTKQGIDGDAVGAGGRTEPLRTERAREF